MMSIIRLFILCIVIFPVQIYSEGTPPSTSTAPASQSATTRPADTSLIDLSIAAVQDQIKQAESIKDEKIKSKVISLYQQSLQHIKKTTELTNRANFFEKIRKSAPETLADIRKQLDAPAAQPDVKIPDNVTLEALEHSLSEADASLAEIRKKINEFEGGHRDESGRRIEIPKIISNAKNNLDAARQTLNDLSQDKIPFELNTAKRTELRAVREMHKQEIATAEMELTTYNIRSEVLAARKLLDERKLASSETAVLFWQKAVNNFRKKQAQKLADAARRILEDSLPEVKILAGENTVLADERTGPNSPASKIDNITRISLEIQQRIDDLKQRDKRAHTRVEAVGLNQAVSLYLRTERSKLPDLKIIEKQLRHRQSEISRVQTRIIQLGEDQDWYSDTESRTKEFMTHLPPGLSEFQKKQIKSKIRELLIQKQNILNNLAGDYNAYFEQLITLDTRERELINISASFSNYIDEKIFWFKSTDAFSLSGLHDSLKAAIWILNGSGWRDVFRTLGRDIETNPLMSGLGCVLIIILLVANYRIHRRFKNGFIASETESFYNTLKVFVLTLFLSVVKPAIIFYFLWRISCVPDVPDFVRAVAYGLYCSSIIFLTIQIMVKLCLPGGIAESHFKWNSKNSQIIRNNLYWLMMYSLPLIFIMSSLDYEQDETEKNSLGRIAFILLLIGFAVFLERVLVPLRLAIQKSLSTERDIWIDWLHYIWYPAAIGIPAVLAILSLTGYHYTAIELGWRVLFTLWVILGTVIVRELLFRWISLAYEKIIHRNDGISNSENQKHPTENLFVESVQARKLLDSLILFGLIVGLWQVWIDVFPALEALKDISFQFFTLLDLILAIVIILLTYIAAKNIPGLLGMVILSRLPLDKGLRFAFVTLSRYVIITMGIILVLNRIGIDNDSIKWLVAAMTLGLSFGLQEIFANLVSGIIILFERPIRVGDVISVGDITGTVTKIQIRSTTLRDWDRRELIVPNKELITTRVINWTLSDRNIRIRIPVGVAYGSNTDVVQQVLVNVAKENPNVMSDPAPMAIFKEFGPSSLDFELYAYVPNIDQGLKVRHELNSAIERKFRENKIQIPFPQQEIHVRSFKDFPFEQK
jgi:potassium efflux system protein